MTTTQTPHPSADVVAALTDGQLDRIVRTWRAVAPSANYLLLYVAEGAALTAALEAIVFPEGLQEAIGERASRGGDRLPPAFQGPVVQDDSAALWDAARHYLAARGARGLSGHTRSILARAWEAGFLDSAMWGPPAVR